MLVLSRRVGESLILMGLGNSDITITVTDIAGGKVKIGIDAPLEVKILRRELLDDLNESEIGG